MAIHFSHPQVILYWTELIIGIICVALAGRGYNEAFVQYLITVSALFSLGDIAFLFVYGFATSRPIEGWSITKIIETVYQMLAALLYCIGFGSTVNSAEYLHPFIGPLTVFISLNMGTYIFGSMVALTELVCRPPEPVVQMQHPQPSLPPLPRPTSIVIEGDKQIDGITSGF
ncbi:hypothetical protein CRM22_006454 [Opisthorchis felineus]|uniref:MARVEL domain-containing protein n=1 Tax=Opisthorchis felineus TaxID=147828 RepID=A0A4S2LL09_OPIFE|nr:hypothetical protein CRM22_006454 [Opisthorchis felineus]